MGFVPFTRAIYSSKRPPMVVPFCRFFFGGGVPYQNLDYKTKGTRIKNLAKLEDLVVNLVRLMMTPY